MKSKTGGQQVVAVPEPPASLSDKAKSIWRDVVPTKNIRGRGRLLALEQSLLLLDKADKISEKIGSNLMLTTPRSGVEHGHPLLKVELQCRQLFLKIWLSLGLHGEAYNPFSYGKDGDPE